MKEHEVMDRKFRGFCPCYARWIAESIGDMNYVNDVKSMSRFKSMHIIRIALYRVS